MGVVLSSPIGFPNTTYQYEEIAPFRLDGWVSYVNHPATKALLESLGVKTVQGTFNGCGVGESFLAAKLRSNPRIEGYTQHTDVQSLDELQFILCTRLA